MQTGRKLFLNFLLAGIVTTIVLLTSGLPGDSMAAYYKCVDENGSTTYNDRPCAANESTRLLSKHATTITTLDCRIAQNFIMDITARWQQEDTRIEVIEAHAGNTELTDEALSMINYIYNLDMRSNSVRRVIQLSTERCEAGFFGEQVEQCNAFPTTFIDGLGGCGKARDTDTSIIINNNSPGTAGNGYTAVPALKIPSPALKALDPR